MISIVKYRYFTIILHVFGWSILLFFPYFISSADNQYSIGPLPGLYFTLSVIIHMIIFYSNALYLYPKFLNRKYWWLYVLLVVTIIIISVGIKSFILGRWFTSTSPDARNHILFPSVLAFIASIFYSITVDKIRAEKLQKENNAIQLAMELKFLRSQINPHFLFNTLTNIVSLARKKSDHLEQSLLMLSGLMRYMLKDAGNKITLTQEIEYLQGYIALQKLRFGRDIEITFHTESSNQDGIYSIEPMLLIPFVENAFKHGTGCTDQPFIHISLTVSEGVVIFRVINRFEDNDISKDEVSGIGLLNVRSRLALLYSGKHDLTIHTDNSLFTVNLKLVLI